MEIKKKAEIFAVKAHDGQFRKADLEKPYIIHPIDVANKLRAYGFGDDVIAAGYLHDVVEDTKFTLQDIENLFGRNITSLVKGASEKSKLEKTKKISQKETSWEERKQETIERIKGLDFEHRAIVCADKISNLEDILILSGKIGHLNFNSFKRGFEQQKWYYENLYQSFIDGYDKNLPMFQELKQLIDLVFHTSFKEDYTATLAYKKKELLKLKSIFQSSYPSFENLYFKNLELETYDKIKEYFQMIGIKTYNLTEKYSLVGEYPQICYNWNEDILSIGIETYYNTIYHTDMIQSELLLGSKESQSQLIVDTIMKDLYDETLNVVKRKIRERKDISLD